MQGVDFVFLFDERYATFEMFSLAHLFALLFLLILFILMIIFKDKITEKADLWIRRSVAVFILSMEWIFLCVVFKRWKL